MKIYEIQNHMVYINQREETSSFLTFISGWPSMFFFHFVVSKMSFWCSWRPMEKMGDFPASASDFLMSLWAQPLAGVWREFGCQKIQQNIFFLTVPYRLLKSFTFEPGELASDGDWARITLFAHALSWNLVALLYWYAASMVSNSVLSCMSLLL